MAEYITIDKRIIERMEQKHETFEQAQCNLNKIDIALSKLHPGDTIYTPMDWEIDIINRFEGIVDSERGIIRVSEVIGGQRQYRNAHIEAYTIY